MFGLTGSCPEFCSSNGREEDERVGFAQLHPLCKNPGITAPGNFDENVGIDENRHLVARRFEFFSNEEENRLLTRAALLHS